MPTLDWIGKNKVVNHHLDVPYCVLNREYSYDEFGQHKNDNGSKNMIIHGDNLLALKSLLPQYEGRIKCIYIDPPYNTGNEGWIYNDNVNDPRIKNWLGEVVGKEGEDRIIEKKDFYLNGFIRHYPDFMIMTKSGKLLLIEVKGDYLDGEDSKSKLSLGRKWQEQAGRMYRYFMVFKEKELGLEGAYTLEQFVDIMKEI